jgi:TolB protein
MKLGCRLAAVLFGLVAFRGLSAQDTTNAIRLGVRGASSAQPGLAVLAGPGLDSVRAIVVRDLENSNRFTMPPHGADSAFILRGPFNPAALKGIGLTWVVELEPAVGGVDVKLYDMSTGTIRQQATRPLDPGGVGDTRMTIHRVSDLVSGWTGNTGIAATRIAFKGKAGRDDAIWRIDSDGANLVRVSPTGRITATPAWSPDGSSIVFSEFRDGRWTLYLDRLSSGTRTAIPNSSAANSMGPSFAPDGKTLVYSHGLDAGYGVESVDISRMCCAHILTHDGRFADNVSPTYSPDGQRIAYVSNRTGVPEIYVMDDDGTGRTQLVPSDFEPGGRPLPTYSPAWSPDGSQLVFDRDTPAGGRQLYIWSVGSGQVRQLTAAGRNDDPSWAPDSRHIVFKSTRAGGREQLWIIDTESSAFRQIATPGGAQYPAWSRALGTNP